MSQTGGWGVEVAGEISKTNQDSVFRFSAFEGLINCEGFWFIVFKAPIQLFMVRVLTLLVQKAESVNCQSSAFRDNPGILALLVVLLLPLSSHPIHRPAHGQEFFLMICNLTNSVGSFFNIVESTHTKKKTRKKENTQFGKGCVI